MQQALILAAGEGRRLRPFTLNRPKAMICIAGKPIIEHVIEALAAIGNRNICIIVGYKREQIFDYLGDGKRFGVTIRYVVQDKQLGTAQALKQAQSLAEDKFIVLAGDKLIAPETITNLGQLQAPALLVKQVEDPSRYGVVNVENGQIISINEKPTIPHSNLINTGIYIFDKSIFDIITTTLDLPDVINDLISRGKPILAVETNQLWLDMIYPWDILDLNTKILEQTAEVSNGNIESGVSIKGKVTIGKGTTIRANSYLIGPVIIGENCDIGPYACISPSTSIGSNVKIAPFTQIKNSVIGDNVTLGAGSDVVDTVIGNNCYIGAHFSVYSKETEIKIDWQIYVIKIGAMIGEGCEIGNQVVLIPGAIIGNNCKIQSQKTVTGILADKSIVV